VGMERKRWVGEVDVGLGSFFTQREKAAVTFFSGPSAAFANLCFLSRNKSLRLKVNFNSFQQPLPRSLEDVDHLNIPTQ
jgi:hypothetical protein